jgi:hypothetical protein
MSGLRYSSSGLVGQSSAKKLETGKFNRKVIREAVISLCRMTG